MIKMVDDVDCCLCLPRRHHPHCITAKESYTSITITREVISKSQIPFAIWSQTGSKLVADLLARARS